MSASTTLPLGRDLAEIDLAEVERFHQRHPARVGNDDRKWRLGLVGEVLLILVVWEVAVSGLGLIRPAFLPPPTAIAASLVALLSGSTFLAHLGFSVVNMVIGLALACTIGISLGFAVGWFRPLEVTVSPLIWSLYATPTIALAPILILWLGLGPPSKIMMVVLLSVFPILLNTMDGVRTVDPSLLKAARVFGNRGVALPRKIVLPAILPFVLVGLRRGIALAFIGEIMGEFLGGTLGLGYLLQRYIYDFRLDAGLAVVIVMVAVVNAGLVVLDRVRQRVAPWYTGAPIGTG